MSKHTFLEIIKSTYGKKSFEGDEFGGAGGATGQGLPDGEPGNFMFATGIECSNPMTNHGRRDQLEECRHYEMWRTDLGLVSEMGLKVLRYGLPIHKIFLGPQAYDWSFADQVMAEIKRLGITPILDLLHFGLPTWIGDFQNPELPVLFADYVEAVVIRYPWVRYYTPVNEIFVTARASALDGIWNERHKSTQSFVTAMKHCVAASILASHRIAKHRNDCIIVQSESAEYMHCVHSVPSPKVALDNKLRFLSLDLLYGHFPDADVLNYLFDNGMSREEFDWFMKGEPPGYQVMGNDYYGRNEKMILPDGKVMQAEDVLGWYLLTKEYHQRYRKPVMHTETNHFDEIEAPRWLWKQWVNVLRIRADGVPVLGFTWYSLIDQIDWDSALFNKDNKVNPCGLFDLERKPRLVAHEYRKLLKEFGHISIVPHGEMFTVSDKPAILKIEV
ncbi:MAG: family 1 glycosylhydrolase [Chitinophagaceae bacterium]|nr:family 1 glycosylhydrolase [Oligoflexus sp.]